MDPQVYSQNQHQIPQPLALSKRKSSKLDLLKNKKVLTLIGVLSILIIALIGTAFAIFNKPKKKVVISTPVTITFWGKSIDENVMSEIIKDFEAENPLIKVKYVKESETDYKTRLQTRLSLKNSTNLPEIVEVDEPWIDEFSKELYPLDTTKFGIKFSSQMTNNNKVAGTVYGMPFNFDAMTLAYNKNHLSEKGYVESDLNKLDWSLLASRAKQVTKTRQVKIDSKTEVTEIERAGIAIGSPKTVKNADKILQLLLIENDAKIYDEKNKTYKIDSKFDSVTNFYSKFTIDTIWDDSLGSDITAFSKEKVSMILVRAQDIREIQETNPNLKFVTVLPPIIGSVKNLSLSTSLVLPKAKQNYNESSKFLDYISSPEVSFKMFEAKNEKVFIPSNTEALSKIPLDSPYAVYLNISPTVEKLVSTNYDEVSKFMTTFLENSYATFNKKLQNPKFTFDTKILENNLNQINKK